MLSKGCLTVGGPSIRRKIGLDADGSKAITAGSVNKPNVNLANDWDRDPNVQPIECHPIECLGSERYTYAAHHSTTDHSYAKNHDHSHPFLDIHLVHIIWPWKYFLPIVSRDFYAALQPREIKFKHREILVS